MHFHYDDDHRLVAVSYQYRCWHCRRLYEVREPREPQLVEDYRTVI